MVYVYRYRYIDTGIYKSDEKPIEPQEQSVRIHLAVEQGLTVSDLQKEAEVTDKRGTAAANTKGQWVKRDTVHMLA